MMAFMVEVGDGASQLGQAQRSGVRQRAAIILLSHRVAHGGRRSEIRLPRLSLMTLMLRAIISSALSPNTIARNGCASRARRDIVGCFVSLIMHHPLPSIRYCHRL